MLGNTEKDDGGNAQRFYFSAFLYGFIDRKLENPRHGFYFVPDFFARDNKEGIYKIVARKLCFAHHRPERIRHPKPAQAFEWFGFCAGGRA